MKKQILVLTCLLVIAQLASAQKIVNRDSLAATLEVWVTVPVVTPDLGTEERLTIKEFEEISVIPSTSRR